MTTACIACNGFERGMDFSRPKNGTLDPSGVEALPWEHALMVLFKLAYA